MEIKVKLNEAIHMHSTIKSIMDDSEIKLNVLLKFRLLGVMRAIEPHILNFEMIKNEKILEYGRENKDGTYQIQKNDTKSIEKFTEDMKQVLDSEVSISVEPFTPDEVIDKGLKSDCLIDLYPIIRE